MKQTVEEAAKEYWDKWLERNPNANHTRIVSLGFAFKAGAEWQAKQSPWIRAKDRLPPVDENDTSEQSEPVLVQLASKEWFEPEVLIYNKYYHVWDSGDGDDYKCHISDNDLWMPIPSFDEILETNKDVLERIKEKGD